MGLRADFKSQRFVAIVMTLAAIALTACTVNVVRGEEQPSILPLQLTLVPSTRDRES